MPLFDRLLFLAMKVKAFEIRARIIPFIISRLESDIGRHVFLRIFVPIALPRASRIQLSVTGEGVQIVVCC